MSDAHMFPPNNRKLKLHCTSKWAHIAVAEVCNKYGTEKSANTIQKIH